MLLFLETVGLPLFADGCGGAGSVILGRVADGAGGDVHRRIPIYFYNVHNLMG
jgi:hypothetical protein